MSTAGKRIRTIKNESGYAYVMVLVAVVVLAILSETAYELTSYRLKHDREAELLFRGQAYLQAIRDYYLSNPPGTTPTYPRNLSDLLSDPRYAHKRHIRMLYPDPVGKGDWNLVRSVDGGISGVVSACQDKPLKTDQFPAGLGSFAGAQHYSDWVFLFDAASLAPAGTATAPASAPAPLAAPSPASRTTGL